MKILHVLTDMDPKKGGVCQAVRTMIYGLNGLGYHNEATCLNPPGADFLKDDKFTVHAVGAAKGPWAYNPICCLGCFKIFTFRCRDRSVAYGNTIHMLLRRLYGKMLHQYATRQGYTLCRTACSTLFSTCRGTQT